MGKYLDILDRAETRTSGDISDISDQREWSLGVGLSRGPACSDLWSHKSLRSQFSELECRCPNHVDPPVGNAPLRTVAAFLPDGESRPMSWVGPRAISSGWMMSRPTPTRLTSDCVVTTARA